MVVITLFVPCLASFLVIIKEQGIETGAGNDGFYSAICDLCRRQLSVGFCAHSIFSFINTRRGCSMENRTSEEITEVLNRYGPCRNRGLHTGESNPQCADKSDRNETLFRPSVTMGPIAIDEGNQVRLLPKGREMAEKIIRRASPGQKG